MPYGLGSAATAAVERSTGASLQTLSSFDLDEELKFIESKRGSMPTFSRDTDGIFMPRGNVLLAEGEYLLPEDVDAALEEIHRQYELSKSE